MEATWPGLLELGQGSRNTFTLRQQIIGSNDIIDYGGDVYLYGLHSLVYNMEMLPVPS